MTIHLTHRTASGGRLWDIWEIYDAEFVVVTMRRGIDTIAAPIEVCSSARPRLGHFCLTRLDEHTWEVHPVMYSEGRGSWVPAAYHEDLPREPLVLANATEQASAWLADQ